ncbi:hypothetical protein [Variovorax sp. 278MFTsu5.1]|uniref:hypothetical protein n=1 Tax=Variovorax sp. 278MFTsu5.1 TaxID=3158366 RepID=UPI003AB08A4D
MPHVSPGIAHQAAVTDLVVEALVLPFGLFPEVHPGDAATIVPEKPFSREIGVRIKTVDRVIDSAAGTFGVLAELDNTKQALPGGIRCRLRLGAGKNSS